MGMVLPPHPLQPASLGGQAMTAYGFSVNGMMRTVEGEADMPLLYALRNNLGLTAAKFGCGL
ncbi:hypothetical protein ABTN03_19045, partial [Acinetobacter baumannii]